MPRVEKYFLSDGSAFAALILVVCLLLAMAGFVVWLIFAMFGGYGVAFVAGWVSGSWRRHAK